LTMKNIYYILIAAFGFAIDQSIKYFFMKTPRFAEGVFINNDFAWGLPVPNNLTALIMILILFLLIFFAVKKKEPGLWIIIAGAFSNLIDRIFYSGVIDYIHTPFGGVINIADAMISFGVLAIILNAKKTKI